MIKMEWALLIISILIAILAKCADPKLNQNKIRITDDRSMRQQGHFVDSSNNHINMNISNKNNYPYLKSYSSSFISKSSKLINTENTLYLNKAKTEENFDTIVVIELSILTIVGVGSLVLIVIAIQSLAYLQSKKSTTLRIVRNFKLPMVR